MIIDAILQDIIFSQRYFEIFSAKLYEIMQFEESKLVHRHQTKKKDAIHLIIERNIIEFRNIIDYNFKL